MKKLFTILGMLFTLSVNAQQIDPQAPTICDGDSIILSAIVPGYNPDELLYMWLQNGVIVGNNSTVILNPIEGLYIITVNIMTLDSMWVGNPSTNLTVHPLPTVTVAVNNVSCYGQNNGSITANASGGSSFSYLWSTGSPSQSISNLSAGNYSVVVTNNFGCSTTATAVVTQPSQLTATAVGSSLSCFGDANGIAVVSAVGGTPVYSYLWSNGAITQSVNGLSSGNYNVTVTDANGCSVTTEAVVIEPTEISINITTQDIACAGTTGSASAIVTGGTPFPQGDYDFFWSSGSQLDQAFGLEAGEHTLTVFDANNCVQTQDFIINPGNNFAVSLQAIDACEGGSLGTITVGITGGSGNYEYDWNNGATSSTISDLLPGTYEVTVTDLNTGCESSSVIQIQENPEIVIALPSNITVCEGSDTLIFADVGGGNSPLNFAYFWELPNGQYQAGVGPTGVSPVITGNYILTVSEGNCSSTDQVFILVIPCVTSVENIFSDEDILMYPNPLSSGQNLTIALPTSIEAEIKIIDCTGKTIAQCNACGNYQISTSGLAAGTYMVQIATDDKVFVKRLVVK